MNDFNIEILERETKVILPENLVFGKIYSDHMFEVDYDEDLGGWHNPTIRKFGNIDLSPAAMVLHYGQTIFEGLKEYKQVDGRIALFRPEKNVARLNRSAKRMCIPEIDPDLVLQAMLELVRIDKDWIPTKPGHALYIRPVMFASEPLLGVRTSENFKLIIMLSPVGPYYPEGFKPVPILATNKYKPLTVGLLDFLVGIGRTDWGVIGAAMIIAFAYMIFTEVSKTMAFAFNLDPVLSGWVANLIFLVAGLITIMKTKT